MLSPASYPHRVLLAVSGLSPQIITETLYALAVSASSNDRFVPTRIEVVTTEEGASRIRRQLLHPTSGVFHRLCQDYRLKGIRFGEDDLHVVRDEAGLPLVDVRSAADNARLADAISDRVRVHTSDPDCALHVSLAGGRKTMGYYAGYALSLFGREQDRLSHVLVNEPFESIPTFWYPRPKPERLTVIEASGEQALISTERAQVSLALIPFVRLRQGLPRSLLAGQASFAATVAAAEASVAPPRLTLDLSNGEVAADGQRIALQPAPFAFLVALASRAIHGRPALPAPPKDAHDPDWAADVLGDLRRAWGEMMVPDKIEASLLKDCSGSKVSPMISRLRTALSRGLAPGRLNLYFDDGGTHRNKRYNIPLPTGAITVIRSSGLSKRAGKLAEASSDHPAGHTGAVKRVERNGDSE